MSRTKSLKCIFSHKRFLHSKCELHSTKGGGRDGLRLCFWYCDWGWWSGLSWVAINWAAVRCARQFAILLIFFVCWHFSVHSFPRPWYSIGLCRENMLLYCSLFLLLPYLTLWDSRSSNLDGQLKCQGNDNSQSKQIPVFTLTHRSFVVIHFINTYYDVQYCSSSHRWPIKHIIIIIQLAWRWFKSHSFNWTDHHHPVNMIFYCPLFYCCCYLRSSVIESFSWQSFSFINCPIIRTTRTIIINSNGWLAIHHNTTQSHQHSSTGWWWLLTLLLPTTPVTIPFLAD